MGFEFDLQDRVLTSLIANNRTAENATGEVVEEVVIADVCVARLDAIDLRWHNHHPQGTVAEQERTDFAVQNLTAVACAPHMRWSLR